MGAAFEGIVSRKLLTAGQVEKQLAIEKGSYHNGVPAITVVVDDGWSKRSHKHSYNANSGVGVIFGAATKALLFIGVRNKYCSICAINNRNHKPIPTHQCYRNCDLICKNPQSKIFSTMHYKTIVKMRYFNYSSFQRPYPFNNRANIKNLCTILFLRAQGIRKSFYRLCILMFSFETCVLFAHG